MGWHVSNFIETSNLWMSVEGLLDNAKDDSNLVIYQIETNRSYQENTYLLLRRNWSFVVERSVQNNVSFVRRFPLTTEHKLQFLNRFSSGICSFFNTPAYTDLIVSMNFNKLQRELKDTDNDSKKMNLAVGLGMFSAVVALICLIVLLARRPRHREY